MTKATEYMTKLNTADIERSSSGIAEAQAALDVMDLQLRAMRSLKGWRMNLIRENLEKVRAGLTGVAQAQPITDDMIDKAIDAHVELFDSGDAVGAMRAALEVAYRELKSHDADYHYRTPINVNNMIVDALAPQPASIAYASIDRRWLAETIDPGAKFDDIEGVTWSRFTLQQRELAYEKADRILAAITGSTLPSTTFCTPEGPGYCIANDGPLQRCPTCPISSTEEKSRG